MRIITFLLLIGSSWLSAYGQNTSAVTAEVKLAVRIRDSSCFHGATISFVNHTNQKIYIPDVKDILWGDQQFGIIEVKKNGRDLQRFIDWHIKFNYVVDSLSSLHSEIKSLARLAWSWEVDSFVTAPHLLSKFAKVQRQGWRDNKRILEKFAASTNKEKHPWKVNYLFLKPHETKKYVFIINVQSIFERAGHYKISYRPMLDSSCVDQYPNEINGYKKFIPSKIKSNIIYVDVVK